MHVTRSRTVVFDVLFHYLCPGTEKNQVKLKESHQDSRKRLKCNTAKTGDRRLKAVLN